MKHHDRGTSHASYISCRIGDSNGRWAVVAPATWVASEDAEILVTTQNANEETAYRAASGIDDIDVLNLNRTDVRYRFRSIRGQRFPTGTTLAVLLNRRRTYGSRYTLGLLHRPFRR